jgi:TRAP transporter TAXI family solute receptor
MAVAKRIARLRERFAKAERRELLFVLAPLALLFAFGCWFAYRFVEPAPPSRIAMSTGAEGGAYHAFAQRYQKILARDGITLELRPSAGAIENLKRLSDESAGVSVGFVQAGVGKAGDHSDLLSLGRLYPEPLWIFHRLKEPVERIAELKGRRIAVGPEGSGTRALAVTLLAASELDEGSAVLSSQSGKAAVDALLAGSVDAAFLVASPEAENIRRLLAAKEIRLVSVAQADAYARRFPFLSKIVLAQGVIDLARNVPSRDVVLVAPTANLLVRSDLHPAIITLLAQAAREVHGGPGPFNAPGEYPVATDTEYPMSADAVRFYRQGPPFLLRYLPFWLAVLIERLAVMLVPVVTILIPVVKFAPMIFQWRVRRRIIAWYTKLREIEESVRERLTNEEVRADLAEVDRIEAEINDSPLPRAYTDQFYNLRAHIDLVRNQLKAIPRRT